MDFGITLASLGPMCIKNLLNLEAISFDSLIIWLFSIKYPGQAGLFGVSMISLITFQYFRGF